MQKLAELGRLLNSLCGEASTTQKQSAGLVKGPVKNPKPIYLSSRSVRTKSRYDFVELQKAIDLAG